MTDHVGRRPASGEETASANRAWWDAEAPGYHAEHGAFLGDDDFVWGPEGWTEADLGLLRVEREHTVLEIGAGAGQCSRWLAAHVGCRVVATDLSRGMLRTGQALAPLPGPASTPPLVQCDGLDLPFADASFDRVFTAYGVLPFVADSARVLREVARVLRPGGRAVASTSHPLRWALPDVPGEEGLTVHHSYFDRTPYVEMDARGDATYVEHHRTVGDRVREAVAAGLVVEDLVEPEWKATNDQIWGGWSPLRGALIPGTLILVLRRP